MGRNKRYRSDYLIDNSSEDTHQYSLYSCKRISEAIVKQIGSCARHVSGF